MFVVPIVSAIPGDLNSDSCVTLSEVSSFVSQWLNGQVSLTLVSQSVSSWLLGCGGAPTVSITVQTITPSLPITISPFNGKVQEWWGSYFFDDWESHALPNMSYIVSNPDPDSVDLSPTVLMITLNYSTNFTGFINGAPRTEIMKGFYFSQGKVYKYNFKLYIPTNYQFDYSGWQQRTSFVQLWMQRYVGFDGSNYIVDPSGTLNHNVYPPVVLGSALGDTGKWVDWEIEFRADYTGGPEHGYFTVRKNGVQIYHDEYPTMVNDGRHIPYAKWGIYKWDWQHYPTKANFLKLYFDDFQIFDITDNTSVYPLEFNTHKTRSNLVINANTNGSISKVEFYRDSVKLGEDTSSPYSYTWINVPVGAYKITAKAIDNSDVAASSSVGVVVSNN